MFRILGEIYLSLSFILNLFHYIFCKILKYYLNIYYLDYIEDNFFIFFKSRVRKTMHVPVNDDRIIAKNYENVKKLTKLMYCFYIFKL